MEIKKIVTQTVTAILPDVLIDYLWTLALTRAQADSHIQTFTLIPNYLGGKGIQDIFHEAIDPYYSNHYKIFGITPVNQKIEICFNGNVHEMHLTN